MNELELKYGCNPNQKPSRIFMREGGELPITVINGRPGYINFLDALNSCWFRSCGPLRACPPQPALSMSLRPAPLWGLP